MAGEVEGAEVEGLREVHRRQRVGRGVRVVGAHLRAPARALEAVDVARGVVALRARRHVLAAHREVAVVLVVAAPVERPLGVGHALHHGGPLRELVGQPEVRARELDRQVEHVARVGGRHEARPLLRGEGPHGHGAARVEEARDVEHRAEVAHDGLVARGQVGRRAVARRDAGDALAGVEARHGVALVAVGDDVEDALRGVGFHGAPVGQSASRLGVAAEDPVLVEGDAPRGGEVGGEARAGGDAVAQGDEVGVVALGARPPPREGVREPGEHLEHRQVDVRGRAPDEVLPAAMRERPLEVREEFRHARVDELRRAPLRLGALVLVVEARPHGVVRVVDLVDEVRDGELELVRPAPPLLVRGRQPEAGAEELQHVHRLRDQRVARAHDGRREGRLVEGLVAEELHHGRGPAAPRGGQARDVHVVGARVFEGEADELAAPLDRGPVEQLVSLGGHGRGVSGRPRARSRCVSPAPVVARRP